MVEALKPFLPPESLSYVCRLVEKIQEVIFIRVVIFLAQRSFMDFHVSKRWSQQDFIATYIYFMIIYRSNERRREWLGLPGGVEIFMADVNALNGMYVVIYVW